MYDYRRSSLILIIFHLISLMWLEDVIASSSSSCGAALS